MRFRLFAIRDGAVSQFFPPVCHQTPGEAQRWFEDLVTKEGTPINKHPADYALYEIGSIDTETALLEASTVVLVCTAVDLLHEIGGPKLEVSNG